MRASSNRRFWIFTGLDSLFLGLLFLFGYQLDHNHIPTLFAGLDSKPFSIIMILAGLFTVIVFAVDVHSLVFKYPAASLMAGIWFFSTASFWVQAFDPDYQHVALPVCMAILTTVLFGRIVAEAVFTSPSELRGLKGEGTTNDTDRK